MSVLIENKSNTNTQDKEGMSALHWACSRGHLDAVKLLIEYGAFPNHMESTEDRYTPLGIRYSIYYTLRKFLKYAQCLDKCVILLCGSVYLLHSTYSMLGLLTD